MTEYEPLMGELGHAMIAILVITPEEFQAAAKIFDVTHQVPESACRTAALPPDRIYDVVVQRAADRGSQGASEAIIQLTRDLRPAFIFLAGTAGASYDEAKTTGREGVGLGDVVVGDFIEYIEFGKMVAGRFDQRRQALDHPSHYLRTIFAENVQYDTPPWHGELVNLGIARPDGTQTAPAMHVGNIGAGEKILSDGENPFQKTVTKQFEKVKAFEMESFGVARSLFSSRRNPWYNPQYLTVRGISDYTDAPSSEEDRPKWTPYAASCALLFTRAVVDKLRAAWRAKRPAVNAGRD